MQWRCWLESSISIMWCISIFHCISILLRVIGFLWYYIIDMCVLCTVQIYFAYPTLNTECLKKSGKNNSRKCWQMFHWFRLPLVLPYFCECALWPSCLKIFIENLGLYNIDNSSTPNTEYIGDLSIDNLRIHI